MTGKIVLRRRTLLPAVASGPEPPGCWRKVGEVAGGAAADCAVLCCCCPCGLVNLLVLAVYKLPAGLWRRTTRMRRRRKKMNAAAAAALGGWQSPPPLALGQESPTAGVSAAAAEGAAREAADVMEEEMWDRFHSTGFWRSLSRRGT